MRVAENDETLYAIETEVIAASPNVFDTGTPQQFVEFLIDGGAPYTYIAYDSENHAVGYIALSALAKEQDAVEVRSIAVKPASQSMGYGETMMREVELIANKLGRSKIKLVTNPENSGAVRFYQRLSYTITASIDNYYGDGTPRYVLEKLLEA